MLDLSSDIEPYWVIDFAALVDGGGVHDAQVTINQTLVRRRVLAAPALLTVVAETAQVGRGIDGWH